MYFDFLRNSMCMKQFDLININIAVNVIEVICLELII